MVNYEIEVKYLLRDFEKNDLTSKYFKNQFRNLDLIVDRVLSDGDLFTQSYLDSDLAKIEAKKRGIDNYADFSLIRIRKIESLNNSIDYVLTLKSKSKNKKRLEEEFNISEELYSEFLKKVKFSLIKKRLVVIYPENKNFKIEFDVFLNNKNSSLNNLVLAEIEVNKVEDLNKLFLLGKDVSELKDYTNSKLAKLNN